MTRAFHRPALICNSQSGSYDEAVHRQLVDACRAAGVPLAATVALPDDDLPDAEALRAQDIDLLAVWTGDGTINAAATRCAGWSGAVLPLPGGTLNLLSKQLHGDRPAADILTDALAGRGGARPFRPSGRQRARRSSPSSPDPRRAGPRCARRCASKD